MRKVTRSRFHECSACGTRSRLPRTDREVKAKGVDVPFWIVVGLLGVGFVALLRWVG
jgi:hypothetical protein